MKIPGSDGLDSLIINCLWVIEKDLTLKYSKPRKINFIFC